MAYLHSKNNIKVSTMKKTISYFSALLITVLFFSAQSFGYTDNVHRPITELVVETSDIDDSLVGLGYESGIDTPISKIVNDQEIEKSVLEWIVEGGWREDDSLDECDPGKTRAANHFHDPTKNWAEAYFDKPANLPYQWAYGSPPVSALLWGLDFDLVDEKQVSVQLFDDNTTGDWSWPNARELFYQSLTSEEPSARHNNFADTLRAVGQVAHLVEDMSVPAHTRNDTHIFPLSSSAKPCWPDVFKELLDYLANEHKGAWHYETYTSNWAKKGISVSDNDDIKIEFNKYLAGLIPVYPDPVIFSPSDNIESQYTDLAPISGLFDRNIYSTSSTPPALDSNTVGLAEYSHSNFFSLDTIWEYSHPAKEETSYQTKIRTARDGNTDEVLHIYRNEGTEIPISAVRYFAEEVMADSPEIKTDFLDEKVYKSYASFLLPRAIGYSAALLDYFFRGKLEITPPDQYVYSVIDGGEIHSPIDGEEEDPNIGHQLIKTLKAKVRNNTPDEEMMAGELVAVAKYKRIIGYRADLESGSPTLQMREETFSYSASVPIAISSLSSTVPEEFTFDFTNSPIPAGITDLYLQIVFKGTLGNETEQAIAVGTRDLREPQHITIWNDTDYFQVFGVLMTAEEVREQKPLVAELNYVDPFPFTETIGFSRDYPEIDAQTKITIQELPDARYSRIIVIADAADSSYFLTDNVVATGPGFDHTWKYSIPTIAHQENSEGGWDSSYVYRIRRIVQHYSLFLMNAYPELYYTTDIPESPKNILGPFSVTIH